MAFAGCLVLVLSLGVLGVLLLNTAMQQQSDRLAGQRQRLADLSLQLQVLRTQLDVAADPARLATRARELHLRPVTRVHFVDAASGSVSARRPAAGRAHAG